jgi:hypothetical protein
MKFHKSIANVAQQLEMPLIDDRRCLLLNGDSGGRSI